MRLRRARGPPSDPNSSPTPADFNQRVIDEFRTGWARMGGYFEGARLLLLTTTGTPHATPVGYLPDGGDRVLVIASAGGSARHPDWFRNLVAHPQVSVESGTFTYEARAADAHAAIDGRGVVVKTSRVIPVVALHSVAQGGPGNINATSFAEAVGGRWPPAPPPSAPSSASTA